MFIEIYATKEEIEAGQDVEAKSEIKHLDARFDSITIIEIPESKFTDRNTKYNGDL